MPLRRWFLKSGFIYCGPIHLCGGRLATSQGPADTRRPYWAFAWSGGQALARYLLDHRELVAGRRVLDFAAGGGIASIAAAQAGATHVTATEIDSIAGIAIALNAQLNGVEVTTLCEDILYSPNRGWEVVLAGDIWYTSLLAQHGLQWLQDLASQGLLVLIGDPGRHYSPSQGIEELACYHARSVPDLEHPNLQEVRSLPCPATSCGEVTNHGVFFNVPTMPSALTAGPFPILWRRSSSLRKLILELPVWRH